MKKSIKIISYILIFAMLFLTTGTAFADSGKYSIDENMNLQAKIAIGIGAIDEYDSSSLVLASDFAHALNVITNYDGTADNYFKENVYNEKITFYDALIIMCDVLGYGCFFSENENDRRANVMSIASKYGLMRNISLKATDVMTMEDLANLIYNTLLANPIVVNYYLSKEPSYVKSSNDYLDMSLDMYLVEGVVESTSFSSISSSEGTDDDSIIIDGIKYYGKNGLYENYIGMNVTALVQYTSSKKYVLALFDNSECFEVSACDINYDETNEKQISYFDKDNKCKTLKISSSADVLYNGSLLDNFSANDFKLKQGRLVLINNDSDNKYDVVKIEEYKSMYVFSVSVNSKIISGTDGQTVDISKLIENEYPVYDGDKLITALNIPTNKVITYFENKNGDVVKIYLSNETVGGVIEEIEKNKNKIVLSGVEYTYVQELKDEIEKINLRSSITANLNIYGEICSFEMAADAYLYAYLIAFDEGSGIHCPKLKMFTQNGKIEILDCKSVIRFNGSSVSASEIFRYNLYTGLWDEIGQISQLIKYQTDKNGKITQILLEADSSNTDADRPHKEKDGVYSYYSDPHTLSAKVRLNRQTKVFLVPTDLSFEHKYKFGDYDVLKNDTDYSVRIYDIDDDYYAGAVVARIDPYGVKTVDDMGSEVFIATRSAGRFTNDLGKESAVVYGYKFFNDEEPVPVRITFNRDEIVSTRQSVTRYARGLKFGDVFQTASEDEDMTQEQSNLKLWYVPGEMLPFVEKKGVWYSENTVDCFISDSRTYAAGRVIETIKNGFIMNFGTSTLGEEYDPAWDRVISVNGNTRVFVCDMKREVITKGCVGDVMPGDEVFVVLTKAIPAQIVVYRN